jgi:quercetin dioxygenase-like cupin family protein
MMTRCMLFVGCQLLVASVCVAQTGAAKQTANPKRSGPPTTHIVRAPSNLQWNPISPPGAEMAVVSGDPDKTGAPFVIRIKNPDGSKVPPHWHPTDEHITVLTGTFVVGMGSTFDPAGGQELTVGSYMLVPKQMRHFAMAKGDVIIQVHGIGPFRIIWVNPEDDPAKNRSGR